MGAFWSSEIQQTAEINKNYLLSYSLDVFICCIKEYDKVSQLLREKGRVMNGGQKQALVSALDIKPLP